MVLTVKTPTDIIGEENMEIFLTHMRICYYRVYDSDFPEKLLNKEVGQGNRKAIADALQALRDHGFYPLGLKKNGRVRWGVVTRSASLDLFENQKLEELKKLTLEELSQKARKAHLEVLDNVTVKKSGVT